MRLDHFLPSLAKGKDRARKPLPAPYRLARQLFPASWLATQTHPKPGRLRRWLKGLGPTWASSPIRRVVQTCCLLGFLWLFFFLSWPYGAQPAAVWPGWIPLEVDADSGVVRVSSDTAPRPMPDRGEILHISEPTASGEPQYQHFAPFRVIESGEKELTLRPAATLAPDLLERISLSIGPWILSKNPPDAWPSHYADAFAARDRWQVELFLLIDPLVSLSTAIAGRYWVWSLWGAAVILLVCIFIPRGFCGYICPLGTVIDLFDWAVGRRVRRFRVGENGWWVHIKYYLLAGVMVAALGGVLISGVVAAIPVLTRAMLFILGPLQLGWMRGWHQVPPINFGQVISILLFLGVLGLGLLRPRFWCKYVCPSGAVFSLGNIFRATERKVEESCINCNKCVEICPFDAIKADFTTRETDCTLCQTCGGVCPTQAIKFVERNNRAALKAENDPPTGETAWGRRSFLASGLGLLAGMAGGLGTAIVTKVFGARLNQGDAPRPVRPPGSVPEQEFLEMCIRCGQCFQVCPNSVLQPMGFEQGLEGLWSPRVVADWAGCDPSCNACGKACPTGAIRALPLEEKRVARMGLAIVNEKTCLPWAGEEACQLCVDECIAAGYRAIEFVRVQFGAGSSATAGPTPATSFLAPKVDPEKCVGCGLCQTRCFSINVKTKHLLKESAIIIEAGPGKEDRMLSGSYQALQAERIQRNRSEDSTSGTYLPEFLK